MVKDNLLSSMLQIPPKMIQKWKQSNDYRFLVYSFLQHHTLEDYENFINSLRKQTKDSGLAPIYMTYKKDFLQMLSQHTEYFLAFSDYKDRINIFLDKKIVLHDDKEKPKQFIEELFSVYSFFLFIDDKELVYVELASKIPEVKPLTQKIKTLKKAFDGNYNCNTMIYITSQKKEPLYLLNKANMIEDVAIINVNIDEMAKRFLSTSKLIFVPSELDISKLADMNVPALNEDENIMKITKRLLLLYSEYRGLHLANQCCSLLFFLAKNASPFTFMQILMKKETKEEFTTLLSLSISHREILGRTDERAKIDEMYEKILMFFRAMSDEEIRCWVSENDTIKRYFYEMRDNTVESS